jgi:hypothetical protein
VLHATQSLDDPLEDVGAGTLSSLLERALTKASERGGHQHTYERATFYPTGTFDASWNTVSRAKTNYDNQRKKIYTDKLGLETEGNKASKEVQKEREVAATVKGLSDNSQQHLATVEHNKNEAVNSGNQAMETMQGADQAADKAHDNLGVASKRAEVTNEIAARAAAKATLILDQARVNKEQSTIALNLAQENSDVAKTTYELGRVSIEEGKEAQQIAKDAIKEAMKQVALGNQARNDSSIALGKARDASGEAGKALAEIESAASDSQRITLIAQVIAKQREVDVELQTALFQHRAALEDQQNHHTALIDAMAAQQEAMEATMLALDDTVKAQKQHGETLNEVLKSVRLASASQREVITAQEEHLSALDGVLKSQEATSTAIDEAMQDAMQSSKDEMDIVRDDILQASQQIAKFENTLEEKQQAYDRVEENKAEMMAATLGSIAELKTVTAVFAVSVLPMLLNH